MSSIQNQSNLGNGDSQVQNVSIESSVNELLSRKETLVQLEELRTQNIKLVAQYKDVVDEKNEVLLEKKVD